jgi:hypothetical protein
MRNIGRAAHTQRAQLLFLTHRCQSDVRADQAGGRGPESRFQPSCLRWHQQNHTVSWLRGCKTQEPDSEILTGSARRVVHAGSAPMNGLVHSWAAASALNMQGKKRPRAMSRGLEMPDAGRHPNTILNITNALCHRSRAARDEILSALRTHKARLLFLTHTNWSDVRADQAGGRVPESWLECRFLRWHQATPHSLLAAWLQNSRALTVRFSLAVPGELFKLFMPVPRP